MPRHRLLALTGVTLALLSPITARADRDRRVGLVVTVNVNVTAEEAAALSAELGEAIRESLPIDVIAGDETTRRLPPDGIPDECVAESACRNDLGRRLDADELLLLVIVRMAETIQIDATWANVASGQMASRPRIELPASGDRKQLLADAAPRLLPHVARESASNHAAGSQVVVIEKPVERDDGRRMTLPAWIATGAAGVALTGGVLFALSSRSKYADLDKMDCRTTQCSQDDIDSGRRAALVADVLFGTAIAAGTTAFVFYMISEPAPARETTVSAAAGRDSIGLVVRGWF